MLNEQLFKIKGNDLKNSCSISGCSTDSSAEKQPIVEGRHRHKQEHSRNPTLAKTKAKSNHFTEHCKISRLDLVSPACSASDFLFMFVYFGLSFSYLFIVWLQDQILMPKATVCCTMVRRHWVYSRKSYFNECHKQ